eukprot:TRINITY_DN2956_c0_g2_i2.p1 TRINITY_DN2956_c0_g2~~TRINITY_DN2956_c0_g2_i2.p1  ORF type:complete len:240 (-),score=28.65 TRINITY_DN2956_c0_g2_i2:151-870(-)
MLSTLQPVQSVEDAIIEEQNDALRQLTQEMSELNCIIRELGLMADSQQATIDKIENLTTGSVENNIARATAELSEAVRYKASTMPLSYGLSIAAVGVTVGLLVGIAAPIGLIVGGAVGATAGGVIGGTIGTVLKKQSITEADKALVELNNVSWEDSSKVTECGLCQSSFNILALKHHCRACGKVFCDDCTSKRMILRFEGLNDRSYRVCNKCFSETERILQTTGIRNTVSHFLGLDLIN